MSHTERIRILAQTSDAAFALYVSGLEFPGHLAYASRFAQTHPKGLVLMPRGHAKTTLFIHRAARQIGQSEGKRRLGILTAVEADALSRSAAIRTIVMSERFAEIFPWARRGVRGAHWTDAAWSVKGAGLRQDFTCVARGLRSVRAGLRLDDLLADDLVGLQENASAAQREHASRTYWSVVDPMVVAGGTRTFLGTRWHEDDLHAELMRKGWPSLVRQATEDGQALWPTQWPSEALAAKRLEMGSALYNLQYMNDPEGMGGNIFRREWFKYVDTLPANTQRRAGMDLAAGVKETSDFTALGEMAEDRDGNLYVVGSYADRIDEGHRQWLTGMREDVPDAIGANSPRLLWPLGILPPGFAGTSGRTVLPTSVAS